MTGLTEADVLENKYFDNTRNIEVLTKRNREIILSLVKLFHGVSSGDIVLYKGKECKVSYVEIRGWSVYDRTHKPWVHGFVKNKDGSWGKADRCLYSEWERVQ